MENTAVSRWAVRCGDCLDVGFVTENPSYTPMHCASCGGPIEVMGRVGRSSLYRLETQSACNGSCTGARGPQCDCHCGGVNHGTHRTVTIRRELGAIPTVTLPDAAKSLVRATEFRATVAELQARLAPVRTRRYNRVWLSRPEFDALRGGETALAAAAAARTHVTRMKKLTAALTALAALPAPTVAPTPVAPPPSTSTHVGVVGARQAWSLTLIGKSSFETTPFYKTWGGNGTITRWFMRAKDAVGNVVVWFGDEIHAEAGDAITVTGTVKEHGDYKGVKQTTLFRVAAAAATVSQMMKVG